MIHTRKIRKGISVRCSLINAPALVHVHLHWIRLHAQVTNIVFVRLLSADGLLQGDLAWGLLAPDRSLTVSIACVNCWEGTTRCGLCFHLTLCRFPARNAEQSMSRSILAYLA